MIRSLLLSLVLASSANAATTHAKHDSRAVAQAKLVLAKAKANLAAAKHADRERTKARKVKARKAAKQAAARVMAQVMEDEDPEETHGPSDMRGTYPDLIDE